jgi:hypothetical protein
MEKDSTFIIPLNTSVIADAGSHVTTIRLTPKSRPLDSRIRRGQVYNKLTNIDGGKYKGES